MGSSPAGTAAQVSTIPRSYMYPDKNMRFMGLGYTGTEWKAAGVIVGTDGSVSVSNYSLFSSGYVSLDSMTWQSYLLRA